MALLDRRFESGGPVLLAARIDDKPRCYTDGAAIRRFIRHRFMQGLGTGRQSPLDGRELAGRCSLPVSLPGLSRQISLR